MGTEHPLRPAPPFAFYQDFCDGCLDSQSEFIEAEDQASDSDAGVLYDDSFGVLWGLETGGGVGG